MVPGTYNVVVKLGSPRGQGDAAGRSRSGPQGSPADWQAWDAATVRAGQLQNAVADAINRIIATRKDVNLALAKLDARDRERDRDGATHKPDDAEKALRQSARDLQKRLTAVERRLYVSPDVKGLVEDETTALSQVENVRRALGSAWETPSPTTQRLPGRRRPHRPRRAGRRQQALRRGRPGLPEEGGGRPDRSAERSGADQRSEG